MCYFGSPVRFRLLEQSNVAQRVEQLSILLSHILTVALKK